MDSLELGLLVGLTGRAPILRARDDALVHALGSAVVLKRGDKIQFLRGHTDEVTCLALSKSGRFLASGQKSVLSFPAPVIIWDLAVAEGAAQQPWKLLHQHNVKVQAVAFSPCERYVATLGGEDDGNLVVWELGCGQALCGAPAHNDFARCLAFFNCDSHHLVTGGNNHLRVWHFDSSSLKLHPTDVAMGPLRRDFTCLEIDSQDACVYAGSSSGDVVQANLARCILRNSGPVKAPVHRGVTCMRLLPGGAQLLLGGGDGSLMVLAVEANMGADPKTLRKFGMVASTRVASSAITSVLVDPPASSANSSGGQLRLLCCTASSELYRATYSPIERGLAVQLEQTAPSGGVADAAFPSQGVEVFATAEHGAIRVWHMHTGQELLHATVPGVHCTCVEFAQDGKSIISGWEDGCIRGFGPQSGKLLYTIHNAHARGVTAIASAGARVISGGEDGLVRVWRIRRESQVLEVGMKEHTQAVNCITLSADGRHAASAAADGSAILWDLSTFKRCAQILDSAALKGAAFHPSGSELVLCGSNRCIEYCSARPPCEQVCKLEASQTDAINSLCMSPCGRFMISGGADGAVKLWSFEEARCVAVGHGHSSAVTRVRAAPVGGHILSVGAEGALLVWRCPQLARGK